MQMIETYLNIWKLRKTNNCINFVQLTQLVKKIFSQVLRLLLNRNIFVFLGSISRGYIVF